MTAMRKTYRFNDGTVIEPRDAQGRGSAVHSRGWIMIYSNGQRVETRDTLTEIRARHGKATAFDPRFES